MKAFITSLLLIFTYQFSCAQAWETVAYLTGNYEIQQLEVVSENTIYVAAKNEKLIRWDGVQWSNIGDFDPLYVPFFQYNSADDIYATHNDYLSGDGETTFNYIAHWDGNAWSNAGELNADKPIGAFKIFNSNEMYAIGNFKLPGYNWKPIATYNGNDWEVLGLGDPNAGAYATYGNLWVNNAHDIYATSGYSDSGTISIKHWNGTNWTVLYGDESINRLSNTQPVSINEVYSFGYQESNGHSCIALWDGEVWQPLGDIRGDLDLSSTGYNGRINYKYVNQDEIYAVGSALKGAESFTYKVAKWNGNNWEELGNLNANKEATSIDIYNGYLYIAGDFTEIAPMGGLVTVIKRYFIDSFFITATSNPVEGGTVSGTGVFSGGETATLTAIPENGYQFVNWTVGETEVSNQTIYDFEVESDRELTANFELSSFSITTSSNPVDGGITSGNGVYNFGETATLTATTSGPYTFENWTHNGEIVSTDSVYEFVVDAERELVANFQIELSIPDFEINKVIVFPNPVENILSLKISQSSIIEVQIFDLLGKLVVHVPGNNTNSITIDTHNLENGSYILKAYSSSGSHSVGIIKN